MADAATMAAAAAAAEDSPLLLPSTIANADLNKGDDDARLPRAFRAVSAFVLAREGSVVLLEVVKPA